MMPNTAGLYLGADFVDLVVLGSIRGAPHVLKSIRVFLFDEAQPSGRKDRIEALPLAIQKAFSSIRVNIGALNFGLPQDEVMVRNFNMPYIPDAERASAVKFEAQKYLPFRLDDTVSDFYVTRESKTTRDMDILFVAANKEALNKYAPMLKGAAVRLNIFDVEAIALLRLLSAAKRLAEDQMRVVVYAEKDIRASVIIARDENVYLSREVSAAASKKALLEAILNNIRLSIDYYKRETREVAAREIILCGEGELSEIEGYLKENISNIPITTFELKNELPGLNDASRKQLIALGLAMASFEKPRAKINLLGRAAKGGVSKAVEEYKPLVIETAAFFLILAAMQVFGNIGIDAAKKKIAGMKEEKAAAVQGVTQDTSGDELLMMEARLKSQINFLENLAGGDRFFLTKRLNALGGAMPQGAWIESFQFMDAIDDERTLNIKGMIYSEERNEAAIADKMLSNMKNSRDFSIGFEDIRLGSLEKVSAYNEEVLAFGVKCGGRPLRSYGLFSGDG